MSPTDPEPGSPRSRAWGRITALGIAVGVLLCLWIAPAASWQRGELEVRYLDVDGNAAIYRGPCGKFALIDAPSADIDHTREAIGTDRLEWILVSHYDGDHMGGVVGIGSSLAPNGVVYDRGGGEEAAHTKMYHAYFRWAEETGRHQSVRLRQQITLCEGDETVTFNVVWVGNPGTTVDGRPIPDENDRSICLLITYRNYRGVSCGDLNGTNEDNKRLDMESRIAPGIGPADSAVANHHAGAASSNETWIDTIDPAVWIVTERSNTDCDTIGRLSVVSHIYITRSACGYTGDGDIVYTTDGMSQALIRGATSGQLENLTLREAPTPSPSPSTPVPSTTPLTSVSPPPTNQGANDDLVPLGVGLAAGGSIVAALGLARGRRRKRRPTDRGTLLVLHECQALLQFQEIQNAQSASPEKDVKPRKQVKPPGRWKRVIKHIGAVEAQDPSQEVRELAGDLLGELNSITLGHPQASTKHAMDLVAKLLRCIQDRNVPLQKDRTIVADPDTTTPSEPNGATSFEDDTPMHRTPD